MKTKHPNIPFIIDGPGDSDAFYQEPAEYPKAPKGNVGTVRAGIFEPMSIPDDLKKILDSCEIND